MSNAGGFFHEGVLRCTRIQVYGDIFSQAILENQLLNIDEHIETMLGAGIPEESRAYLGMAGFKVRINFRGELLEVVQPGMIDPEE